MSKALAAVPRPVLPEGLLTVAEAAAYLRIRQQGVRELAASGRLAYFRVGRKILITREDLARFLAGARREVRP